ncbi:MAG: hypothetical protein JG765_2341 [Cereibacter sp.]|jgi:cellulose synthase/poly-beta-1,6-N-acetylglucosamine synthase-like glycosyltransferase|nr:hypothetical protein [Cereibacter sp.]
MLSWSHVEPAAGPEPAAPDRSLPPEARAANPALRRAPGTRELWLVWLLVALSTVLFCVFVGLAFDALRRHGWSMLPFALMIGGLFYCALAYQVIRLGAAVRRARPAAAAMPPEALMGDTAPSVTVLIPSYQESRRVLIETVLSAALATWRNKRIVVLVDDPPNRPGPLAESLGAIADVRAWVAEAEAIRTAALAGPATATAYAGAHDRLAAWLHDVARRLEAEADPSFAHVDGFVIDRIVLALAARHRAEAWRLRSEQGIDLGQARDRLAATVSGEIVSFQRKRFANLSHAANKAMNLNAYLGLMGGDWRIADAADGAHLLPAGDGPADLSVPMTDYVLTLDADSVIVSDYILTLVGILEAAPGAAVAQTPYLTFPNGVTPVERIAGATTDIQYLIHQGSSHYGAAYWVGANAIIRRRALEDIRLTRLENGHEIAVFVQDKTVIEDTGSTIDLQDKGWHVHNHFEPLAYSATPADFGALAIQRKRWANGGLILFFDLLASQRRQGRLWRGLPQLFVRSHYLLSPLIGNVGILALMLLSAEEPHAMFWAPLFMAPYFLLYMADLRRMGYRWWDLFGVCALNLMLLPVNLAGVLASIWQMAGGPRRKFSRTPKVASRTVVPPYAFVFNLGILGLMLAYVLLGIGADKPLGVAIPLINILLYSYGLWRFVGLGAGFADLGLSLGQSAGRLFEGLARPMPGAAALPVLATAYPMPVTALSLGERQRPLCRAAQSQPSEEDR